MDCLQMQENDSICNVLELVGFQNPLKWMRLKVNKCSQTLCIYWFLQFKVFVDVKEGEFDKRPNVMHIMVLSISGFKIRGVYGRQMDPNVTHIMVLAFSHFTGYQT